MLAQTYQNLSIVLINDGSTDMSLEIAKTYCALDSRFVLIDKENGGVSSTRNAGLDFLTKDFESFCQAPGIRSVFSSSLSSTYPPPPIGPKQITYVFFLDSDDFIQPDCIGSYVQMAQENNLEIVGSGIERYSSDYELMGKDFSLFENIAKNEILEGEAILRKISQNYFHAVWNLLIDFDFFKRYGFRFIPQIIYEDHCFGTFLFLQAKRVMIANQYFYAQVSSLNSITRPKQITQERKILDLRSWIRTIEEMQKFPTHRDLLNTHISYFYLPMAYEACFKLKDRKKYQDRLRKFKYRTWKLLLLRDYPYLFFGLRFLKRILISKIR